eukprot:TRINITY_DN13064_c0_g1_i1.p1 TRINITY_DN13064_c0_g1~~TRINITY_DN13064_c0_g1_i1.p1  ORF type:complete len:284 (-),score=31.50 TRINITY_DN13064_c0_g1_i1:130-981(-)
MVILHAESSLVFIRTIGCGIYGTVDLVEDQYGNEFAQKRISKKNPHFSQANIRREQRAGEILNHSGICAMVDFYETDDECVFVFEYIDGSTLMEKMEEEDFQGFSEDQAKAIFKQLIEILRFCHSKGVVHRDIKLDNIMIDANERITLIDFGLCQEKASEACTNSAGSIEFCSPEVRRRAPYDGFKADSWSAGVVLYTLLFGEFPYDPEDSLMLSNNVKVPVTFPSHQIRVSEAAKDLVRKMLETNPKARPSLEEVSNHEWVTGISPVLGRNRAFRSSRDPFR